MPLRPPLTLEQLRDFQIRRREDADVIALLSEVRRIHGMLLRAHQIQAMLPSTAGHVSLDLVLSAFRELLAKESVVIERGRVAGALIGQCW